MVAFVTAMARRFTDWFPLWAVLLSAVAYGYPAPFAALSSFIPPLLGLVMLGMGLTLTTESFRLVLRRPGVVVAGVLMQFCLMPLIAFGLARLLALSPMLTAGMVLVGACPGGTASNVITFLARGEVALSIALTTASTLLAVVATPLLSLVYLKTTVDVPAFEMLLQVLQVVLAPVLAGTWLNTRFGARLAPVRALFPVISVLAIVLIIAIIIALTDELLTDLGPLVFVAVALHNAGGLLSGYIIGKCLRFTTAECRTLAIEVGMQNSGLGVALANQYFSAVAALPGALFSIWHNLSGSALAAWWSRNPPDSNREGAKPVDG